MTAPPVLRLTPAGIVARLDERVVGQHAAKHKLAGALWWNHHRRLLVASGVDPLSIPPRQNVLLAGPSGTGKTLLARAAAELARAPCFCTPATSYSRVGYVGLHPEDMIAGLLEQAGGDVAAAERGVVFLDEVDKLRKRDLGGQDDVGGDAVQQMLLPLLEGTTVHVKKPGTDEKVAVSTAGVTFVAAGAFAGLEEVVLRRLNRGHDVEDAALNEEAYRHLSADDLVGHGLLPEFVARFSVRAGLVPLTAGQLGTLFRGLPTSPLAQLVRLFRLHGIELVVEEPAAEFLLGLALGEKTGARALFEVLNDRLAHVVNALPEMLDEGVTRVLADVHTVRDRAAPWKIAAEPLDDAVNLGDLARQERAEAAPAPPAISDTKGWSERRIRERLDAVKTALHWADTAGSARKWWDEFERENSHRLGLVLRLAEELALREATLTEFFLAYVYSNTDNIQANLHYLDYTRLKKQEERRRGSGARSQGVRGQGSGVRGQETADGGQGLTPGDPPEERPRLTPDP